MTAIDFEVEIRDDGTMPPARWAWFCRQVAQRAGRLTRFRMGDVKRTGAQNRFYWGFRIRPIREAMLASGYLLRLHQPDSQTIESKPTDDLVHDLFAGRYLGNVVIEAPELGHAPRKAVTAVRSSTDLSVSEFADYLLAIETDPLVEALGVYLPEPGEAGFDKPFRSGRIERLAA